jgi:uncharacterized protein (TIGR03032 family)
MVSSYQAYSVIFLRGEGEVIKPLYCEFPRPMGMALAPSGALAVSGETEIHEYRNTPGFAARLDPPNRNDAVFLPRRAFVTGALDIHEMAYGEGEELWFVNTLFSCLCTFDRGSSFVPRWRPKFVSSLAPEDRCHLNGLAMRDQKPFVMTALGTTDTYEGWRANKRNGGVAIDFASSEIIATDFCMPHSPRWHNGKLWILDSGRGALVVVDLATGKKTDVARVPGFARGMDFIGPLAVIGLSKLRETNPFVDIPITDDNRDRLAGIWIVDTRSGQTVALFQFTEGVDEIFAVNVVGAQLPDMVHDTELLKTAYILPPSARGSTAAGKA